MKTPIQHSSPGLQEVIENAITDAVQERTKAVIAEVTTKAIEEVRQKMQAELSSIAMRVRSKLDSSYNFDTTGLKVVIQIQFGGEK